MERLTYPHTEIEQAQAKAKKPPPGELGSRFVSHRCPIIDPTGNELFSCQVEDELGWS